jgi:hypothetical protein
VESAPGVTNPAADPALLPDEMRKELQHPAEDLRKAPTSVEPFLALLGRVAAWLDSNPLSDLAFQGSYSQTKVAEPVSALREGALYPGKDILWR